MKQALSILIILFTSIISQLAQANIHSFIRLNTDNGLSSSHVKCITQNTEFEITCHTYGDNCKPALLFEDNAYTLDYQKKQFNWVNLEWTGKKGKVTRNGNYSVSCYKVISWVRH